MVFELPRRNTSNAILIADKKLIVTKLQTKKKKNAISKHAAQDLINTFARSKLHMHFHVSDAMYLPPSSMLAALLGLKQSSNSSGQRTFSLKPRNFLECYCCQVEREIYSLFSIAQNCPLTILLSAPPYTLCSFICCRSIFTGITQCKSE